MSLSALILALAVGGTQDAAKADEPTYQLVVQVANV